MKKHLYPILIISVFLFVGCGGTNTGSGSASSPSSSSGTGWPSSGVVGPSLGTSPYSVTAFSVRDGELASENNDVDNPNGGCPKESCFYFSYDDSASTASVELVKYYLKNGLKPDPSWGRAFEFLNFETFSTLQKKIGIFNVSMGIWSHPYSDPSLLKPEETRYELGVQVSAPEITMKDRANTVLTLLIDVSGSMGERYIPFELDKESAIKTRLDVVKYGLSQLFHFSLKEGDVVNIVQFSTDSTESDVLLEGWNYSSTDNQYLNIVSALSPTYSTNLNAGIQRAYIVAKRTFKPGHTNRVILLTDAYANTGEVDPMVISNSTRINDQEGIYFSGLGIGSDFSEAFLNTLTDAGKGSYFAAITPHDIKKAFVDRFIALLNVAARQTRFRLDFPSKLTHLTTASEQISTDPNKVQTTNFSYNTSQFFLEGFRLGTEDVTQEKFKLTIEYKQENGTSTTEQIEMTIGELIGKEEGAIKDAFMVTFLADLVGKRKECAVFNTAKETILKDYSSTTTQEYSDLITKFCAI